MMIFGKQAEAFEITPKRMEELIAEAREKKAALARVPVAKIIHVLDRVGALWREGSPYYKRALEALPDEISFSPAMIEETLRLVPGLFCRDTVKQRLASELGNIACLDEFSSHDHFQGYVRAFPLGVVFHVTAGNVFLGCIDSLLMGFLTKNVSILKLSSENQIFPAIFAESLLEADPERVISDKYAMIYFPGGRRDLEDVVKKSVDGIVAWGGEEMVKSYKQGLASGVRLLEFGPKISFEVVYKGALEKLGNQEAGRRIAKDIMMWDQAACASPQNLFVEKGIDLSALLDAISEACERCSVERGRLSPDEEVEILKEEFRGKVTSLTEGGQVRKGKGYYLHFDPHPGMRPSALNRTLIIKEFGDVSDLVAQIGPYGSVLQSCGYLAEEAERHELLERLGGVGVRRFAPLGRLMEGVTGAPHDGLFVLRELVSFVGDERQVDVIGFINEAIKDVPYYRNVRKGMPIVRIEEMPFLTADDLARHSLLHSKDFVRKDFADGYVFSSGGTSGNPKFTVYTHAEFDEVAKMLARGMELQGLEPGDVVANLFVAGNLWSSFVAIQRALSFLGAVELPIGGMAEAELILDYLKKFKPKAVIGLPAHLVSLAQKMVEIGLELDIPLVFYAGEHLNRAAAKILKERWKTVRFCSAGYASVDAGPIGYQCLHCADGEHHLFSDRVVLEKVDGEAVVTSLVRKAMPIIRLKTGDCVEISDSRPCACGSNDVRFMLSGRCDNLINIWGCRLYLTDVETALEKNSVLAPIYQVTLEVAQKEGRMSENMVICIEGAKAAEGMAAQIARDIYETSMDVKKTHPFDFIADKIIIRWVGHGSISRLKRTGKIRRVVDDRK